MIAELESDVAAIEPLTKASLKATRQRLGLSQSQLGAQLQVSSNTIACWERGDKPIGNPTILAMALKWLEAQAAR